MIYNLKSSEVVRVVSSIYVRTYVCMYVCMYVFMYVGLS